MTVYDRDTLYLYVYILIYPFVPNSSQREVYK